MTSKREERAIRSVLTTNYAELSTRIAVANPLKLGEKLMADQIVTSAQFSAIQHHDHQSFASQLVSSAKPLLELESGKFKKFLRILLDDVACCNVGRKMCKDMDEEGFSEYLNILEDFNNKPKSQSPEDRNSLPPGKSERGATGKIQVDGEEEYFTPTGGVPSGQAGHLPSHSAHTDCDGDENHDGDNSSSRGMLPQEVDESIGHDPIDETTPLAETRKRQLRTGNRSLDEYPSHSPPQSSAPQGNHGNRGVHPILLWMNDHPLWTIAVVLVGINVLMFLARYL